MIKVERFQILLTRKGTQNRESNNNFTPQKNTTCYKTKERLYHGSAAMAHIKPLFWLPLQPQLKTNSLFEPYSNRKSLP